MSDFVNVTRAEIFKLVRRPAAWVLLGTAVLLNQVFAYVIPYLSYRTGGGDDFLDGATSQQILAATLPGQIVTNTTGAFAVFVGVLGLVLGALASGGEHVWGTVKTLSTQGPGRGTAAAGQFAALAVTMFAGLVVLFAAGALTSTAIALAEDHAVTWPAVADLLRGFGAGWLILVLWGALGAMLGAVMRSVALPIGLSVVWVLGVENLISAVAGSLLTSLEPLRDALPGVNAGSLLSAVIPAASGVEPPPGVNTSIDGTRALLTVSAYVVVSVAVAIWTVRRRDVA